MHSDAASRSAAWCRARRWRPRSCTSRPRPRSPPAPTSCSTGRSPACGSCRERDVVSAPLRIALVGGPMYDHLYARLRDQDVEVVVHEDHPTLNRRVAELLGAGERIDVIATHSKYA